MAEPLTGHGEDPTPVEPLVSLRFITSELRRRRRIWVLTALIGLVIGIGYHHLVPRTYQASTLLLLAHNPNEDPTEAMATDVNLAETRSVAQAAGKSLDLTLTPAQLLKDYSAVSLTPQLLKITADGPTYSQATLRASAITKSFLAFRTAELRAQNDQVQQALATQIHSVQGSLNALTKELDGPHAGKGALDLSSAVASQTQDQAELTQLQATAQGDMVTTTTIVGGSSVIDSAAVIQRSAAKLMIINGLTGLIGGLALGLFAVILPGLLSDKLRNRNDIAKALDAPVSRSMRHRWRLSRRRGPALQRLVTYLHERVTSSSSHALAVISIDSPKAGAQLLELLANRLVQDGARVLIADLTPSGALAHHYRVEADDTLVVTTAHRPVEAAATNAASGGLPGVDDLVPGTGVLTIGRPSETAASDGPLTMIKKAGCRSTSWREAWAAADVLLTLAELNPAHGADHLSGWASDAVAVVTAGRSSGLKIQSVGNMVRHSGVQLTSALLLDADPKDESSGIVHPSPPPVSRDRYAGMASL